MNKNAQSFFGAYFLPLIAVSVYLFLYIPIFVLIVFSFNQSPSTSSWSGFSLRWYHELFQSVDILNAVKNSFIVAISATLLSVTMGVLFVFYSAKSGLNRLLMLFYANLAAPEIVLAVGLLTFFSFFSIPLGLSSLIAGHTLIGLGYVIPLVQTRFDDLDYRYTEASLDLGATQTQTFMRIILPLLMPAVMSSALLVFIISLDDFVISFFTAGGSTQTLPMYIFSVIRSGASPIVNAVSTVLLVISSIAVLLYSLFTVKKIKTGEME